MGVYQVNIDSDNLNSMSEMGNRELTTWRGLKNKSARARHLTDGSILIDKKHVTNEDLLEKFKERRSDETIENSVIKEKVEELKEEKQWVGKIRGQMTNPPGMGTLDPKWIGIVSYRNYNGHCATDGQQIQIVEKLFDAADLKVGESETLTWWRYGVPVAAVATWNFYDINL